MKIWINLKELESVQCHLKLVRNVLKVINFFILCIQLRGRDFSRYFDEVNSGTWRCCTRKYFIIGTFYEIM